MSRQIRVFLSSTFSDMQHEREELIKRVFPGLRRRCRARGVDLVEVDLRWGITEAQATRGEVMPLCIREIDACAPYFVCFLGDRYGSVPETVPEAPWVVPGASMTHMEVHWAALRPDASVERKFFFFRQGAVGNEPQEALKADIRAKDLPIQEYSDPEDLGRRVEAALLRAIDEDIPVSDPLTWLDRERLAMEAFAENRSRVYIPRPSWFARLDQARSVVVTGPSGSGKSALLANWAAYSSDNKFIHFFGASRESTSAELVVHRMLAELGAEVPSDPADHRAALGPCLAAAAPLVIVLDAVEHVDDISWLPHPLPDGVRLVASGLPGPVIDELERRGYPTLPLTPLTVDERRQIVVAALARHGKSLNPERIDRIIAAPQTENALFLRTMAEELRLWGNHETLDEPIGRMLSAPDVPTLFAQILERLEHDYQGDHPSLVGQALGAIAAARRGLTEPELLEVIHAAPLTWAPLHHALEAALMNRDGVLTFFHDGLRQAVLTRYLPNEAAFAPRRSALIEYFEAQPVDTRVAEELPWLQAQTQDLEGLHASLTNLDLFLHLEAEHQLQDLVRWWRIVDMDPADGYRRALNSMASMNPEPVDLAWATHRVARFTQMMGKFDAALGFFDEARQLYEAALAPDHATHGLLANDHGLALFLAGRFNEAEPLLRKAIEISGEFGGILHNLAEILLRRNAVSEAKQVAQRAVDTFRQQLGRHDLTATAMQNLARAQMELGELDRADTTLDEALGMVEGPPTRALALGLSNLGNLRLRQGRLQEAESLLRRSIGISQEVLGKDHPHAAATITALAGTLFFAGREKEAEHTYREAIALMETHLGPEHPNLNNALVALANLHLRRSESEPAEQLAERALKIAEREFGPDSVDAANAVQSLAACAATKGEYDRATAFALRACKLHEQALGANHAATTRSWGMVTHLGRTLLETNEPARAEPLLRASLERAEQRLGPKHPQVGPDLWNLGRALVEVGRLAEAMPLFERELAMLEASKGPTDEETVASRENLDAIRAALGQTAGR